MSAEDFFDLLHRSRILIVEDDEDMSALTRRRFETEGYTNIEVTNSGEEALRLVMEEMDAEIPYDLLILDMRLPGNISGKDVYQKLCGVVEIPIVMTSVVGAREEIRAALKSGSVEEYLVKPLDLEVLTLKCERILARRLYNRQVQRSFKRNQVLFLNILQVMAKVLETKDPYTKFHSENVARYARQLARRLGFNERRLELIQIAGILHDFGKIGIREEILNKPSGLTEFEYDEVKRHPLIGSAILEPVQDLQSIIADIRHHHERWDGKGYPAGLKGEDIPLGARILCLADAFDAMTNKRPYRDDMTEESAGEELIRCKGSHFDPKLVDVFAEVLAENRGRRERINRLREEID